MSNTEPTAQEALALKRQVELERQREWMKSLDNFDWKAIPPHQMAVVLTKKPYKGKTGEPDYYLSPEQALVFAMRCFELGLSPLSSEVWFDRDRWTTNVTLEGQIHLARERGTTSPPAFKELKRPWRKGSPVLFGYAEEPGIEATVLAGPAQTPCSYIVWLSEWVVSTSPVWKSKPEHMMRVRAYEKALEFAGGVGVSGMPDERNIEGAELPAAPVVELPPAVPPSERPAATHPERMPYAQPGWKKPSGFADPKDIDTSGRGQDRYGSLDKPLRESIKQAQEKK